MTDKEINMQCLIDELKKIFQEHADKPFLLEAATGLRYSYNEAARMTLELSQLLHSKNIRRQDSVALLLDNSAEFVFLYLACLFSGLIAVPINLSCTDKEKSFILKSTKPRLLVCSPSTWPLIRGRIPLDNTPVLCIIPKCEEHLRCDAPNLFKLVGDVERTGPFSPAPIIIDPYEVFAINYTSGTTGKPKGICHSAASLLSNASTFNAIMQHDSSCRFLHVMPMSYMAGLLNTLLCPLCAGASMVLCPVFNPLTFWEPVLKYQPDIFWMSPTMLVSLLKLDRNQQGRAFFRKRVKRFFVGTAPLPKKVQDAFEDTYGVELLESYGLSELLLISSRTPGDSAAKGSVGLALPGINIKILDENGLELISEQTGEILVQTPFKMRGYVEEKAHWRKALPTVNWFPTGDIGYLDKTGHLFITGRKKDLIIKGGINVSPKTVEELLEQHPAVEQAAVVGLPHEFYGEEVVAAISLKSGFALEEALESLRRLCTDQLNPTSHPSKFVQIQHFPRGPTGKIQKSKLREIIEQTLKENPC